MLHEEKKRFYALYEELLGRLSIKDIDQLDKSLNYLFNTSISMLGYYREGISLMEKLK